MRYFGRVRKFTLGMAALNKTVLVRVDDEVE
jgi:hypothetical protein